MKALVYHGPYDIRLTDVAKPKPGFGEVCIQIKAVSICGSDVSGYKGKSNFRVPPLIMGHELSGEIVELGRDAERVSVGQRVTINPNLFCGKCRNCLENNQNLCDNRKTVGTKMPAGKYDGGMAEFLCVPAGAIIPLPDGVSYDEAALLEPLAVSLHAVKSCRNIKGSSVAIVGAGPIGLLAVQCAKTLGARIVIALDLIDERLKMARRCGADIIINSNHDGLSVVKDLTAGVGVDYVIDAVGISASLNQGIQMVRNGGNIILIGLAASVVDLNIFAVVTREIKMSGSYIYTNEIEEGMKLTADGCINLKDLITTVSVLEEGPAIFAGQVSGDAVSIKVILHPV